MYSLDEVRTFVEEEDVQFIRLAFCDTSGTQKNISIMPAELPRAFTYGVSFDGSAISGFGRRVKSDLFLHPDSATLAILPWRPSHGRVARMFCDIRTPDGAPFAFDCRQMLKRAIADAAERGVSCRFGEEFEFYLFNTDERGAPTLEPFDEAGYMDIAPEDRGENVRREICMALREMNIQPESSHHEEGPGQNEIDYRYSDALTAADNAVTFKSVVRTIARRSGLHADFSPKPVPGKSGSGMHINFSVHGGSANAFLAGVLMHAREMTAVLNPTADSYRRLGEHKAPRFVSWSHENRSQLVRIPAADGEFRRMELRSPDPGANPYLAHLLILRAGMDGIARGLTLPPETDCNLFDAPAEVTAGLERLPETLDEARAIAKNSAFMRAAMPGFWAE